MKYYETRLYSCWAAMKGRCNNPHYKEYENYGGRGISVCEEWYDFKPFAKWALSNGYRDDLTIDRIDNDGDYRPRNCRWVDRFVQANNKSNNHLVVYKGKTQTVAEWADALGVDYFTFSRRIRAGWSVERAITEGIGEKQQKVRRYEYNGEAHTLTEWADIIGTPRSTLRRWIEEKGMSVAEALETQPREIKHKSYYFLTLDGRTQPLNDWARELNIRPITLRRRIKAGWSDEDVLTKPVDKTRCRKQAKSA